MEIRIIITVFLILITFSTIITFFSISKLNDVTIERDFYKRENEVLLKGFNDSEKELEKWKKECYRLQGIIIEEGVKNDSLGILKSETKYLYSEVNKYKKGKKP